MTSTRKAHSDPYHAGPFAPDEDALADDGGDAWFEVDMLEVHELMAFADNVPEIRAIQQIGNRALLNGQISFTSTCDGSKGDSGDAIKTVDIEKERTSRVRSDMWSAYLTSVEYMEDALGFYCSMAATNTSYRSIIDTDPLQPTVINIHLITRIRIRVSIDNTYEWEFHKRRNPPDRHGNDSEIVTGVRVGGSSLPVCSQGKVRIRSRIKSIKETAYALYMSKVANTKLADSERARSTLVTANANTNAGRGDDKNMHSGDQQLNELKTRQREEDATLFNAVNCGTTLATAKAAAAEGGSAKRKREKDDTSSKKHLDEYELREGRALASDRMAEAPADTFVAKQAFLEQVCLAYGINMSIVSSGDATGKVKLNVASASSDVGRVFEDTLKNRKHAAEMEIEAHDHFMYHFSRSANYVAKCLKEDAKRKPSNAEIAKNTGIHVRLPSNITLEQLVLLHERAWIKWPALARMVAGNLSMSLTDFNEKELVTPEERAGTSPEQLAGKSGSGNGASSSSNKKKKAKK